MKNKKHYNVGKNHPMYVKIGHIRMSGLGYKEIKIAEHKFIHFHRYLVEQYIGYKLKKDWIIHHIDGDKLNNKLSNLYIFVRRGDHSDFESIARHKIINRFILKSNLKKFKYEK